MKKIFFVVLCGMPLFLFSMEGSALANFHSANAMMLEVLETKLDEQQKIDGDKKHMERLQKQLKNVQEQILQHNARNAGEERNSERILRNTRAKL